MESELSDADLVAMLAEHPTEEHVAQTAQRSVPRYGRRSPRDQLSESRGRHERHRTAEAGLGASSRQQQWLTMALAFACGLLLVITIAQLREAPGVTPAPKPTASGEQTAVRPASASVPAAAAHRDARLARGRAASARRSRDGARAARVAGPLEFTRGGTAHTEASASTASGPPAEVRVVQMPAAQASAGCEAPGDLGC